MVTATDPTADPKCSAPIDELAHRLLSDVTESPPSWLLATLFPTRQLSVYVAQLAASIGELSRESVTCVDGDWRRKDLSKELGFTGTIGLTEYLCGEQAEIPVHAARRSQLQIIPAGSTACAARQLDSKHLHARILRLRELGPLLIAASVDHDPISRSLYTTASASYLLIPRYRSPAPQAVVAMSTLTRNGARLRGAIYF